MVKTIKRLPSFLALVTALSSASSAFAVEKISLDLNDVSILIPLPENESEFQKVSTARSLIPESIHEELVKSMPESDQSAIRALYPKWIAVAYRFDPCFREHFTDQCQRQVRVSWQPWISSNGKGSTTQGALHTFYPVSDTEWPSLMTALRKIKQNSVTFSNASTAGIPLGVHPGFSRGGLTGSFSKELHKIVKPWILDSRMSVLAVSLPIQGGAQTVMKRFYVFDPKAVYRLTPIWISYSTEFEIRYGNASHRGDSTHEFSEALPASLKPVNSSDDLRFVLKNSLELSRDRSKLIAMADVQRRITDPTKHAALTADCLSCHASGPVGAWLDQKLTANEKATLKEPLFINGRSNPGKYNLKNTSANPTSLARFRAFGYEGSEVHILDRVIDESALVAEKLNADQNLK